MQKLFVTILIMLSIWGLNAQQPVSMEEAYQKILSNNLNLRGGALKIDAQKILKQSTFSLDPLNVSAEIGQFNSDKTDHKFSVAQNFRFPGFYQKQKLVFTEEWKQSLLNLSLQKWQLKRELAVIFNELNYLDAKYALIKKADSLYGVYYDKAALRLRKGESNVLEKSTAENYKSQAHFQLLAIEKDKAVTEEKLNFLINDGNSYTNEKEVFTAQNLLLSELENPQANPYVETLKQEQEVQKAKTLEAKARISPNISLGYNNTSLIGNQSDGAYNDGSRRFHSAVIGVGLPLFNKAQKLAIEAQRVNEKIAENNYQQALNNLNMQYKQYTIQYHNALKETDYFQHDGLKNAELILKTANLQFYNGEINYLDYVLLVNQALDIRNRGIDSVKKLNDAVTEMNALQQTKID
ncbi:transporter [Elizabethkingia meningoseptica]|nr:transporter [Elizabethkingia meningoseptica]OPB69390.1 transporter [Elizabethkingia meningoseptica]SQG07293.1 Outer membrane efflux protein [Elizabethkingia meningoseptica]